MSARLTKIKEVITKQVLDIRFRRTPEGIVAEIPVAHNRYICSLLPIAEEDDLRFCDNLISMVTDTLKERRC